MYSGDGKKPAFDNVITNLGSADKLQDAVNLSWEDINVFVNRSQGKCCGLVGGSEDEGDVLHILKNGRFCFKELSEYFYSLDKEGANFKPIQSQCGYVPMSPRHEAASFDNFAYVKY